METDSIGMLVFFFNFLLGWAIMTGILLYLRKKGLLKEVKKDKK